MREIYISSRCSNCGKPVQRGSAKCPHCGVVFRGEKKEYLQGRVNGPEVAHDGLVLVVSLIITAILTYFWTYEVVLDYFGDFNYFSIIIFFVITFLIVAMICAAIDAVLSNWDFAKSKNFKYAVVILGLLLLGGFIYSSGVLTPVLTPNDVELLGSGVYHMPFISSEATTYIYDYQILLNVSANTEEAGILCEFYDDSGKIIARGDNNNLVDNPVQVAGSNETLHNITKAHVIMTSKGIGPNHSLDGTILYEGNFTFNNSNFTEPVK